MQSFLLPTELVCDAATKVTGHAVQKSNGKSVLTVRGEPVESSSQKDGVEKFCGWLSTFGNPVVLVAHNCHAFDMRVLVNAARRENLLDLLREHVNGFGDSLPALKTALPNLQSYSLPKVHVSLFNDNFPAHDAAGDVAALGKVMEKSNADVRPTAVTLSSVASICEFDDQKKGRLASFGNLVKSKVLSRAMADKAAASGLSYVHLQLAHTRSPNNGIECLFKEKTEAGRRVTATKRICEAVAKFFNSMQN